MVIVFCIDPVGTLTACTTNVIPKSAMMTVTTADSKYSRHTDLAGPVGLVSGSGVEPCPFRLKTREKADVFGVACVSETLVESGRMEGLLIIFILDTLAAPVTFSRSLFVFSFHQGKRLFGGGGLGSLLRTSFCSHAAIVPAYFDMERAAMWRTNRLHHRILRRRSPLRLQFLLQHGFVIGFSRGTWRYFL